MGKYKPECDSWGGQAARKGHRAVLAWAARDEREAARLGMTCQEAAQAAIDAHRPGAFPAGLREIAEGRVSTPPDKDTYS